MTYWWCAPAWGRGVLDPQCVQGAVPAALGRRAAV